MNRHQVFLSWILGFLLGVVATLIIISTDHQLFPI